MIGRRGFLAGLLAAGAAPAIVKAESLMKLAPLERTIRFRRWAPSQSGLMTLLDAELGYIDSFRIVKSPLYAGSFSERALRRMEHDLLYRSHQAQWTRIIERDLAKELIHG